MMETYINIFYCFTAFTLLAGSIVLNPGVYGQWYYKIAVTAFTLGGLYVHSYLLTSSALLAGLVGIYRYYQHLKSNKPLKIFVISDHDDQMLHYFLDYYRSDILKYFPLFDFKIEQEFLVALVMSDMELVGLVIAEIKNADTLRICIDYIVPKHQKSPLADTFYNCELRYMDFLGYRYSYIEPQSKAHNNYLESIGFKLVDGKYVNHC